MKNTYRSTHYARFTRRSGTSRCSHLSFFTSFSMEALFSRLSLKQHRKSFIRLQLRNLFLTKENSKSSSVTKENKQKWKKKKKKENHNNNQPQKNNKKPKQKNNKERPTTMLELMGIFPVKAPS